MTWFENSKNLALFIRRPGIYPRQGCTAWKVDVVIRGVRVYVGRKITHADAIKLHYVALTLIPQYPTMDPNNPAWRRFFRGRCEAEFRKL